MERWITALALLVGSVALSAQDAPLRLRVDATDATRRLFHVQMTIPAKPGPVTLLYPKWIPGEHGPTGPITDLVGLKVQAGGQSIPWRRDSVNMYAFHVDVPAGVNALEVAFDFISPPETAGFSSGSSVTSELAVLNWNQLLLYPAGGSADQMQLQATLRVPSGWRYGTALPIERESGDQIEFSPAPLTALIDSPVSMGRNYRTVELGTDRGATHYLHIAADSPRATEISPELAARYRNLVAETGALYGARHYRGYHFLLTLSDHVAHFGLEHHESSDNRVAERSLLDDAPRKVMATLLPHEFTHSWNGKYRRPAGLATGNYETPMKGELLWVYEGLTEYLGEILTPRSGLWSPEEFRDWLAMTAAALDTRTGRTWRPLEDTAVAAQLLYEARDDYANYRRGVDYYPEGTLIWLEADVMIRRMSKGSKSLNDFCRLFLGGQSGRPEVKPYEFEDVVAALNQVQAYDWAGFLRQRIRSLEPHAPLGGIVDGGWKLTYGTARSEAWRAYEDVEKLADLSYSLGLAVKEDGTITDVRFGGPSQKAGVTPATKLIAVNNRQFTPQVLREAIAAKQAVTLLVKDGEYYRTQRVEYTEGERYPRLERDASKPDLLSAIIAPLATRAR